MAAKSSLLLAMQGKTDGFISYIVEVKGLGVIKLTNGISPNTVAVCVTRV